eukprot:2159774-Rhodomonas_salina.3
MQPQHGDQRALRRQQHVTVSKLTVGRLCMVWGTWKLIASATWGRLGSDDCEQRISCQFWTSHS